MFYLVLGAMIWQAPPEKPHPPGLPKNNKNRSGGAISSQQFIVLYTYCLLIIQSLLHCIVPFVIPFALQLSRLVPPP